MRVAALITGLYPPAVRERWGAEISQDVAETGIRSWPDTLAGAVRLWLHPSEWPETLAGQTRRVLAVALVAVTAVTALLLRATEPSVTLTADVRHPATSLWLVPIVLGIGLAVPPPPRCRAALRRLVTTAVRTLAAPAVAFAALVVTARSGLAEHSAEVVRAALIAYYWATLGFTAARLVVLVARVAPLLTMPATRRLSAALLLIGTGLAIATGQSLRALASFHPGALAVTLALGLLSAATISAGRDLLGTTPERS
jgi:hypothetical protein